jgi:PAS domain-containing protein
VVSRSPDAAEVARRVADALAAALHAGVEVVDRRLVRLAVSGIPAGRLAAWPEPSLYRACMRTGLPAWGDAASCNGPLLAYPVMAAGEEAAGAIGVLPLLAGQVASLRARPESVTDLVAALAEPLRAAGWRGTPAEELSDSCREAVLDSMPDGVVAVGSDGVVLYCNRAALAMLRVETDLTGQLFGHWYGPRSGAEGDGRLREVVFERGGHRFRFFEARVPLRADGRILGTLILLHDPRAGVTAVRPARPTLAEAERQLIEDALGRHGTSGTGKRRAARELGISLATLYRKLRRPTGRRVRRRGRPSR